MRQIALSLLLLISIVCYSQHDSAKLNTRMVESIPKLNKDTAIKIDTTKDTLRDSLSLNESALSRPQVKMVLIKDKDTDDWFVKSIFPLITLLLGAAIPLIWEHFASRNRLKKVGKRWTAEIKFLEVPIKEQIEVLDEFLIRHATSDYEIPQLYLLEGLNGEKFASMDKGELLTFIQKFKTPDTNKATSDSNRVNGFISIVKSTDAALKEKFEEYMTRTSTLNAEFSKNLTRLSRAFGDYSVALEKQYNSDAFMNDRLYKPMYELFAKQIHPFVQTGGLTLQHVSTNFLPYLFPLLANARLDPRTAEMTLYLSNCMEALTQISMERGYFQQNAETIKERLKTYLAEIDEIVSLVELKKLPV